jgi:PAS domain S-box-containing protein
MTTTSIRSLLLVEDDLSFARLLREMFKEQGSAETKLTHAETMQDAERYLSEGDFDIILLDPGLPDSRGIESVQRAIASASHVPLVVLTGQDDESLALQALQEGAQDYLVKGQIETRGLLRFLRYAVERNAMEEALFVEKQRAQVTLNSIGDAVACTDLSGNLTFLNRVAEQMTGWSWQEAEGLPMVDVIRILDAVTREPIPDPMDRAVEGDRTVHLPSNSVLIRRDGFEIPIEDSVAPIHDRDEDTAGAVIVFRDVSAARVIQQQLRVAREELERSNRQLQDFATIASHDLQEPLRKIQAFGDRLAEHAASVLDTEASDFLRRMRDAAGRMQSLIDDLLEYSQVSIRPEPQRPVDLGVVVSEVLSDLEERIRNTNGQVHVGPLPTILASPLEMRQLFQNLIANALKFHPDGVAPEVHVEATARGDWRGPKGQRDKLPVWEIQVRDNGIGFEQKYVDKIFAPFQRLNGRQAYEGTGMGLAICRRIVTLRGGTITATSQPGAGATFLITLPRRAAAAGTLRPVA